MRFDAFFRAFYIGESDGHLKGYTTTWAIPKFFAESILRDEKSREKLPQDDMSYDKWFQGNASPRNHWANFAKNYKEDLLVSDLMDTLDDKNISKLLVAFSVDDGEEVNKLLLCTAIAQQFKKIIDGKGEGADVIADIYLSGNIKADFTEYIEKAVKRYNVMKLIGGDEVPLEDFFVSNTIGEKERVFADKKRIKCAYLDEPSLYSIRTMYAKRGYDNLKTVLIGSGGCGKSLMLQHLFLQAAEGYKKTGILPVFLELRYFTQADDLMSFIVKTVSDKDHGFNAEVAHKLFLSGRCQLLLDGFDEIDPSDIDSFLVKLEQFTDSYGKVQIVISSRDNESLTGLHNFIKLYMWPFDTTQSEKLIDKILTYRGETENRETVLEYINNGFLKKDGVFASHPLLLTFVTIKYPAYKRFGDNHLLFYKSTYEALLTGHDDNKKPYDRVFMSVDDANQFSTVFKEFCAITFKDGALQFDSTTFEAYFRQLKSHQTFENPYKMNVKNFKHDVCSTACMMYEKEYDIFYIDPGFQEFLFAEYYTQANLEEMKPLIVLLQSFKDYYYGYESVDGKTMPGYVDMIEELGDKFPLSDPQIIGEQNQKDFIALFGAILRMRNLLVSFDEFAGKEMISERDLQDYLGRYQDLRDEWKRKRENGESTDIIDDIVFEVELIKQIEINIDYILMLVKKYHDTHCEDKEVYLL